MLKRRVKSGNHVCTFIFSRRIWSFGASLGETAQESSFKKWIETKQQSGELWIHEGIRVRKDLSTGSYGLFSEQPITNETSGINSSTELVRIKPSLLERFSAMSAERACEGNNPQFYKSIINMVKQSIAPKASFKHQSQLVSSICLAVQILVVSNQDEDADLRPYLELLASNSYPHSRLALPHPLVIDSHVDTDTFVSDNPLNAPAFDFGRQEASRAEILGWLQGTALHRAIFARKRLYNNISRGLFRGNAMNKTNFDYAMGIVLSRAISGSSSIAVNGHLQCSDTGHAGSGSHIPLTLAPFLDFCNHATEPTAEHVFDKDDCTLRLYSRGRLNAGQEVTIGYGDQRDSLSFLSIYGFLPRKSQLRGEVLPFNVADSLSLQLKLPRSTIITGKEAMEMNSGNEKSVINITIPLVVLFSVDVEAISDVNFEPKKRCKLFQFTCAEHLAPFFTAIRQHGDGTAFNTEVQQIHALLSVLEESHRQLQRTRFWDREEGKYLCKSVAEKHFLDDCQHWVDVQTAGIEALGRAVTSYLQALQSLAVA